jgi:hypothetical protein
MAVRDQYDYNNPTFFNPRGYSQGDNGPGNGSGDGERRIRFSFNSPDDGRIQGFRLTQKTTPNKGKARQKKT